MNRFFVNILLVLMIIEVKVMNGQSMKTSTLEISSNVPKKTTVRPTESITITEPTTTGNSTRKNGTIFGMLTESQWLIVLVVVIAILALVPIFFLCKAMYDCCQPQKTVSETKDTTESTGIKFSSVHTVDSVTGKPISERKGKYLSETDGTDRMNQSSGKSNEQISYERVVKKFKDIK